MLSVFAACLALTASAPPGPPAPPPRMIAAVKADELKDVWVFLDAASQGTGALPSPALTLAGLTEGKSPAAKLVRDRAVILTGAATREGVWAYESRAITRGGMVVTKAGVVTMTAEELAKALKNTR